MSNIQTSSPNLSSNNIQNSHNSHSNDGLIQLAIKFCETNKPDELQSIIRSGINVNTLVPQYKFKNVRHTKVPLISIAVSCNSLDCVKRLVMLNADIEAQDIFIYIVYSVSFIFLLISFFFFIFNGVFFIIF